MEWTDGSEGLNWTVQGQVGRNRRTGSDTFGSWGTTGKKMQRLPPVSSVLKGAWSICVSAANYS